MLCTTDKKRGKRDGEWAHGAAARLCSVGLGLGCLEHILTC